MRLTWSQRVSRLTRTQPPSLRLIFNYLSTRLLERLLRLLLELAGLRKTSARRRRLACENPVSVLPARMILTAFFGRVISLQIDLSLYVFPKEPEQAHNRVSRLSGSIDSGTAEPSQLRWIGTSISQGSTRRPKVIQANNKHQRTLRRQLGRLEGRHLRPPSPHIV